MKRGAVFCETAWAHFPISVEPKANDGLLSIDFSRFRSGCVRRANSPWEGGHRRVRWCAQPSSSHAAKNGESRTFIVTNRGMDNRSRERGLKGKGEMQIKTVVNFQHNEEHDLLRLDCSQII